MDQNTLLIIVALITFLMAVLMAYLHIITPFIKGPRFWSIGSFLIVTGIILFLLFPLIGEYFGFVIASTLTISGLCFYLAGLIRFKEEKVYYALLLLFPTLELGLGSVFFFLFPSGPSRMILYSLLTTVFGGWACYEMLKPVDVSIRRTFYLAGFVFFAICLSSCFRFVYVFINQSQDAYSDTIANQILRFRSSFTQILFLAIFIILVGIRLLKILEEKVHTQQKFFSIIAHDLSGPVGTISEMLKLINRSKGMDEDRKALLLMKMEDVSGATYHLLGNLLHWSKNRLTNPEPDIHSFDLASVVQENLSLLQHLAQIKSIDIVYQSNQAVKCQGDVRMIDTVVRNLLSNAIKFTDKNGVITIELSRNRKGAILKIKDTGIGMSEATLSKLFQFSETSSRPGTANEKGTGLGLLLCQDFLEKNNGTIQIDSKEGVGTEITVTLPE